MIAQIHAHEDEHRAQEEPGRDALAEQPVGKEDGSDGIEVYPVGRHHGVQLFYYPVPYKEARHRRHHAEKEQIARYGCREHLLRPRAEGGEYPRLIGAEEVVGHDAHKTVEEHLPRNHYGGIVLQGSLHKQRIHRPGEARRKCQHIAKGREVQDEMAVKHHRRHAHEGKQRAHHPLPRQRVLASVDERQQQHGKEGAGAHDERRVGGGSVEQGYVLGCEIERAARYAERRHEELVLPGARSDLPPALRYAPRRHQHIGYGKAQGEYLRGRQPCRKEQLGEHKRAAPHCHYEKGYKVVYYVS